MIQIYTKKQHWLCSVIHFQTFFPTKWCRSWTDVAHHSTRAGTKQQPNIRRSDTVCLEFFVFIPKIVNYPTPLGVETPSRVTGMRNIYHSPRTASWGHAIRHNRLDQALKSLHAYLFSIQKQSKWLDIIFWHFPFRFCWRARAEAIKNEIKM